MSESIMDEMLAELTALREENSLYKNLQITETLSQSSFSIEDLKDKLRITGILLAAGKWGPTRYLPDQIKKMFSGFKKRLEKMETTVEHEKEEEFKGKVVGEKKYKVNWNDNLKAIEYSTVIDNPKAIQFIKDGKLTATSMRLRFEPKIVNGERIATKIEPINNSLTGYPACKVANIFTVQDLSDKEVSVEYYGAIETDINPSEGNKLQEETIMGDNEEEYFELLSDLVGVLPKEETLADKEGEIELELMTFEEALARKERIIFYYPKGKYPKNAKKVNRKKVKGKCYSLPTYNGNPVPFALLTSEESEASEEEYEEILAKGDFMIKKNVKTGKFVVFQDTGKEGFGKWKIVKQFDKEEDAKKFTEEQSAYTQFIAKCMKTGKSMKECAADWKKEHEEKAEVKCPACKDTFDTKDAMIEHFNKEHAEKYGKYGEGKYPGEQSMTEEELRRTRCGFCEELIEKNVIDEHLKACKTYLDTVELAVICKFCKKQFPDMKALKAHLPECKGYSKYKEGGEEQSMSEEGTQEGSAGEESAEGATQEGAEGETTTDEGTGTTGEGEGETSEEGEGQGEESVEETVVETPKKITVDEVYEYYKEKDLTPEQIAAEVFIVTEKKKKE